MSRPPYKPPVGGGRRTAIIFVAIIIAMGIIAYAVAFWPRDNEDDDPPARSPEALVSDVAAGSLIVDVGGSTSGSGVEPLPSRSPDATSPGPASPSSQFVCQSKCLVRLTNSRRVNAALESLGLRPAYTTPGTMWAGLTAEDIAAVSESGFTAKIVDYSVDT